MAVFGIACLAYNKNKFLTENPSWKKFDQALERQRNVEIQLQNTYNSNNNNNNENENNSGKHIIERNDSYNNMNGKNINEDED